MGSIGHKSHWGREVLWAGYLLIAALIVGLAAAPASASLTLNPNLVLSGVPNSNFPNGGGTLAGDPFPWLTLEVHTIGTGAVTISGTASTQPSWFFSGIYLNIAG